MKGNNRNNKDDDDDVDDDDGSWISDWCEEPENYFLLEVPQDYISDNFNLFGLQSQVSYYQAALSRILDEEESADEENDEKIELNAQKLYGMIHSRYLTTSQGLKDLNTRIKENYYGICPRVLCPEQPLLPCGLSETFGRSKIKLYCPRCESIYNVESAEKAIDGACFGPALPHLFLMVYPECLPKFNMTLSSFSLSHRSFEYGDDDLMNENDIKTPIEKNEVMKLALPNEKWEKLGYERKEQLRRGVLVNRHVKKVWCLYHSLIEDVEKVKKRAVKAKKEGKEEENDEEEVMKRKMEEEEEEEEEKKEEEEERRPGNEEEDEAVREVLRKYRERGKT